jgi:hypothetical protein
MVLAGVALAVIGVALRLQPVDVGLGHGVVVVREGAEQKKKHKTIGFAIYILFFLFFSY